MMMTYQTWRCLREPFLLPPGLHCCGHDDWELYDCDGAGCRVCGAAHECSADTCPLVDNEGQQVCTITGFCVKTKVFAESEYSTQHGCLKPSPLCAAPPPSCAVTGAAPSSSSSSSFSSCPWSRRKRKRARAFEYRMKQSKGAGPDSVLVLLLKTHSSIERHPDLTHQIHAWIQELLCSSATLATLRQENTRRIGRLQALFVRTARRQRLRDGALNLIDVCAAMAVGAAQARVPDLERTDEERRALAQHCTDRVIHFLDRFPWAPSIGAVASLIPLLKLRGFVVGVVYMMRSGVCLCDSVEILPRIAALRECLPSEGHLPTHFGLSNKIITETENTIKGTLRGFVRAQLVTLGFAPF